MIEANVGFRTIGLQTPKKTALVLTFCLGFLESSNMVMANELRGYDDVNMASLGQSINQEMLEAYNNNKSVMKIDERKTQSSAAHKTNRAVFLQDVLNQITAQAGIRFKVSTDISRVKVMPPVATSNWNAIVKALLNGYNWVSIQVGNTVKTVIITGKVSDDVTQPDPGIDEILNKRLIAHVTDIGIVE